MRVRVGRSASVRVALLVAVAIVGVVSAIAAQSTATPPVSPAEPAAPPPSPDLRGLEPAVASQLAEARAALVALLADAKSTPAARSSEWGTLGQLYHAYGLFDAAAVCYREATRLAPAEMQWFYLLGHAERGRSDLAAARAAFIDALARAPYAPAHIALAEIALAEGDSAGAETAAWKALTLAPGDAAALGVLGQAKLSQRDYEAAVEALESALAKAPAASRLRYPLALAYRGKGDEERAKEQLAQVGKAGVRAADPLLDEIDAARRGELAPLLRGRRAASAGDWKAAAEEFRRALAANPESVAARVDLGAALASSGDVPGARRELEAALMRDPQNFTARFNLGVLRLGAGDAAGALPHLEMAVAAHPGDAEAQRSLGEALLALGRPADALPRFRAGIAAAPFDEPSRFGEAVALVRLAKFAEARERLEEAQKVMPEQGRTLHLFARLLAAAPDLALRDGNRAVELAQQVWTAQPTADHGRTLALALAEAGRCADAAKLAPSWRSKCRRRKRGLETIAKQWAAGPPCRPAGNAATP